MISARGVASANDQSSSECHCVLSYQRIIHVLVLYWQILVYRQQFNQDETGEAQRKVAKRDLGLPGMKQKQRCLTDKNSIGIRGVNDTGIPMGPMEIPWKWEA